MADLERRKQAKADQDGRWVEYRDKRFKGRDKSFYYNTGSRRVVKEIPEGFQLDRSIPVKEVIAGLHFYH